MRPFSAMAAASLSILLSQAASANLDRFLSHMDDPDSPGVPPELRQVGDSVASMGHGKGSFFVETAPGFSDQVLDFINFDGSPTGKKVSMKEALGHRQLYHFEGWDKGPLYWVINPSNEPLFPYLKKYGIAKKILWRASPWERNNYPETRELPGFGHCTGFLIGSNVLMTNNHCVATQEKCDIVAFRFNEEIDASQNSLKDIDAYQCKRIIATDRKLDFSLVELAGDPSLKHAPLRITVRQPIAPVTRTKWVWDPMPHKVRHTTAGEKVHVIGHPGRHPAYPQGATYRTIKKISKPCKVTRPIQSSGWALEPTPVGFQVAIDYDEWFGKGAFGKQSLVPEPHFATNCAIAGGNSGSPVFDKDLNVIGLMNRGNDWIDDVREEPEAYAIPMSEIYSKYSAELRDAGVVIVD